MKSYEELSWPGKQRRFYRLAQDALTHYDLDVRRLVLIGYDTNLIYRVYTADGAQYALRLANGTWRARSDAEAEVLWLEALARDTEISAPRVVRGRHGEPTVTPVVEGGPANFHALLMSWLPGTLLGKRLSEQNLHKMGELFAQLHLHGGSWQPPAHFSGRHFDKMLSRGEPDLLLSQEAVAVYPPEATCIIQLMREKVDAAYAALDAADLRVIHCDLWHDNIKLYRGVLQPFDFEDTIWGYRIHDIAMAMLDLCEEMEVEPYKRLLAAFRRGYESYLSWPEGELEIFQIGRILWRMNYFANHVERVGEAWLTKNAAFSAALFQRYLESGKLIPPLRMPRNGSA